MEDSQQQELLAYWLNDTSFINWAKNSSKGDVKKWNDYFQQHPEEQETGEIVKSIIIGLPITPTGFVTLRIHLYKNLFSVTWPVSA